jgi:chromosome segregation ATPase
MNTAQERIAELEAENQRLKQMVKKEREQRRAMESDLEVRKAELQQRSAEEESRLTRELKDSQAMIKTLRAQVEARDVKLAAVAKENDEMRAERDETASYVAKLKRDHAKSLKDAKRPAFSPLSPRSRPASFSAAVARPPPPPPMERDQADM